MDHLVERLKTEGKSFVTFADPVQLGVVWPHHRAIVADK
jgi:hypothetical protein